MSIIHVGTKAKINGYLSLLEMYILLKGVKIWSQMKINGRSFAAVKKRQVSLSEKMKNNALEKESIEYD